jgi:lysophospholipase L1-like esterase
MGLSVLFLFAVTIGWMVPASYGADDDRPVEDAARFKLPTRADPSLPALFLVGDSTMKVGTPGQRGWGEDLAGFFDPHKINVLNFAIGGRSSRTFQTEGRWNAVMAQVKKGDFVIIQFGHNDPGPVNDDSRARGSLKGIGEQTQEIDNLLTKKHEVVHTFGWYMRKYVNDEKARGATPIVLSLVPRNSWKDGKVVRSTGDNYGGWAQQVAEALGAVFVDDNEIIASGLEKMGQEKAATLFADHKLHASPEGAAFNARMAVSGLKAIKDQPLDQFLSAAGREVPAYETGK